MKRHYQAFVRAGVFPHRCLKEGHVLFESQPLVESSFVLFCEKPDPLYSDFCTGSLEMFDQGTAHSFRSGRA
jgi:hypothetical protein